MSRPCSLNMDCIYMYRDVSFLVILHHDECQRELRELALPSQAGDGAIRRPAPKSESTSPNPLNATIPHPHSYLGEGPAIKDAIDAQDNGHCISKNCGEPGETRGTLLRSWEHIYIDMRSGVAENGLTALTNSKAVAFLSKLLNIFPRGTTSLRHQHGLCL